MPYITYDRLMQFQNDLTTEAEKARAGEQQGTSAETQAFFAGVAKGFELAAQKAGALIDELYNAESGTAPNG